MMDDMALVDSDALAYFTNRRVKKAFMGATGVRGIEGLTVSSSYQYAVKRKMLESAEEKYVLLDSSKFNFMGITLFADFNELTGIIILGFCFPNHLPVDNPLFSDGSSRFVKNNPIKDFNTVFLVP